MTPIASSISDIRIRNNITIPGLVSFDSSVIYLAEKFLSIFLNVKLMLNKE